MELPAGVEAIPSAQIVPVEGNEGILGRGALGEVRRGVWVTEGGNETAVALKRLFMLRDDDTAMAEMGGALLPEEKATVVAAFLRECTILSRANHPNILSFYGIVLDDARQPLFMATALVESGTLRDMCVHARYAHLRSDSGGGPPVLSHALVVDVLLDVFLALEYLHTRAEPVIHRDVKPANVLVEFDAAGQFVKAMLADLGEAKQVVVFGTRAAQSLGSVGVGTLIYMAPEMKEQDEMKGPKVDVFSLGVTAAEISTGRCPAPGPEMVRQGRRRVVVPEEERRADDIRMVTDDDLRTRVVERCITDDPADRADAAQMVAACRQLQRTAAYQETKAALGAVPRGTGPDPEIGVEAGGQSHEETVAAFMAACETDEAVAQICLQHAGWDLELAIRTFLEPPVDPVVEQLAAQLDNLGELELDPNRRPHAHGDHLVASSGPGRRSRQVLRQGAGQPERERERERQPELEPEPEVRSATHPSTSDEEEDYEEQDDRRFVLIKRVNGETFPVQATPSDLVKNVKAKLHPILKLSVPRAELRLVYNGKNLVDEHMLGDYGIQSGSTLHLTAKFKFDTIDSVRLQR